MATKNKTITVFFLFLVLLPLGWGVGPRGSSRYFSILCILHTSRNFGPGDQIDYRNMILTNRFISEQGKIL
ncbi:hypothetical protein ZWY2020_006100 [Hordeum vulgare]|nr:hypothetical protein ZWY2020_006100 [Hordeum vulgare]